MSIYAQEKQSEDIVIGRYVKIHSHIFDEDRTVSVHLPGNYASSDNKYPVVYMLDGESATSLSHCGSMLNLLGGYHSLCPEMILVGIHNVDRARDMTPIKVSWYKDSGKADKFLQFITDELMPYMNKNYRTAPYNILFGVSAGGNFAIYALLENPNSFNAYIAASPFFGESHEYMVNKLKTRFKIKANLYLKYIPIS